MTSSGDDELTLKLKAGEQSLEFRGSAAFLLWLEAEAAVWEEFGNQITKESISDRFRRFVRQALVDHHALWMSIRDSLKSLGVDRDIAEYQNIADRVSRSLDSRELVLSTSRVGAQILGVGVGDVWSAGALLAVYTGRLVPNLVAEGGGIHMWRAFASLMVDTQNLDEALVHQVEAAAAQIRLSEAGSREAADRLEGLVAVAAEDIDGFRRAFSSKTEESLLEAKQQLGEELEAMRGEWGALKAVFQTEFALRAPRAYWLDTARTNRLGATLWGGSAVLVAMIAAAYLLPFGLKLLREGLFTAALISTGGNSSGGDASFLGIFPELLALAVVGFLVLWVLRFTVRQSAECLVRRADALQRVTMVDTFLALTAPGEGSQLVSDGDKAIIVQALFRPGPANHVDDAPPVHWVEDVYRRVKGGRNDG